MDYRKTPDSDTGEPLVTEAVEYSKVTERALQEWLAPETLEALLSALHSPDNAKIINAYRFGVMAVIVVEFTNPDIDYVDIDRVALRDAIEMAFPDGNVHWSDHDERKIDILIQCDGSGVSGPTLDEARKPRFTNSVPLKPTFAMRKNADDLKMRQLPPADRDELPKYSLMRRVGEKWIDTGYGLDTNDPHDVDELIQHVYYNTPKPLEEAIKVPTELKEVEFVTITDYDYAVKRIPLSRLLEIRQEVLRNVNYRLRRDLIGIPLWGRDEDKWLLVHGPADGGVTMDESMLIGLDNGNFVLRIQAIGTEPIKYVVLPKNYEVVYVIDKANRAESPDELCGDAIFEIVGSRISCNQLENKPLAPEFQKYSTSREELVTEAIHVPSELPETVNIDIDDYVWKAKEVALKDVDALRKSLFGGEKQEYRIDMILVPAWGEEKFEWLIAHGWENVHGGDDNSRSVLRKYKDKFLLSIAPMGELDRRRYILLPPTYRVLYTYDRQMRYPQATDYIQHKGLGVELIHSFG